jgi:hypothetical protein
MISNGITIPKYTHSVAMDPGHMPTCLIHISILLKILTIQSINF